MIFGKAQLNPTKEKFDEQTGSIPTADLNSNTNLCGGCLGIPGPCQRKLGPNMKVCADFSSSGWSNHLHVQQSH